MQFAVMGTFAGKLSALEIKSSYLIWIKVT